MMSPDKWTETHKKRARILYREFPDIPDCLLAYHSLRMIFSQKVDKEKGSVSLKEWYAKVGEFGNKAFNDIAPAMTEKMKSSTISSTDPRMLRLNLSMRK